MKAVWQLRFILVVVLLVGGLTACELSAPGNGDEATLPAATAAAPAADAEQPTADANVGGGVPADPTQTPPGADNAETAAAANPTATPEPEASPTTTADTPRLTETATATPTPQSDETTEEAETSETTDTTVEDTAETSPEETTTEPTPASPTPNTHIVAVGENLYRIGLRYGVSWVRLAQYNNLGNPNQIIVGQVLQIPGGTPPPTSDDDEMSDPQPTPSPLTETTYRVRAGDNLYRIGLAYGTSWIQIAEANGIVNPNQIIVGQELKIPVDAPGPTPQFTHQVKPNETLFLISLQYGVPWTTIAEANNITSPFVIYEGQSLLIPGG